MTEPDWRTDDAAYDEKVQSVQREQSVEAAISLVLRESRYVTGWFPPYSSGAGDMIEYWLMDLRDEWRRQDREAGGGS